MLKVGDLVMTKGATTLDKETVGLLIRFDQSVAVVLLGGYTYRLARSSLEVLA